MRESLVAILRCPADMSRLEANASARSDDGHIIAGRLTCTGCGQVYSIEQGVPNMLPPGLAQVGDHDLSRLQKATVDRFGFEWRHFRDWGWLDEYPAVPGAEEKFFGGLAEHTRSAFWSKSLFQPRDLHPGLLVLDAGCGNGRFTVQAARTGAEVVGIDLGWGVHSAFDHTRAMPNVHIVRGDLFRLPCADATFERIFSIGVLQHTGNAGAAFDSLARTLRPAGLIAAHVYGRGRVTYEFLDALIRTLSTRMPISTQLRFSRAMAAFARWLRGRGEKRKGLYRRLYSHVNLLPTEIHMYDWWSAPVATHHNPGEVQRWFARNELEVLATNPPRSDVEAERTRRYVHGPITALGRKTGSCGTETS